MKNDYKKWMPIKAKINNTRTKSLPVIRAGQIYWVSIGQNIGYEEDGKSDLFTRPALVIKVFGQGGLFLSVPLSTTDKTGLFYYTLHLRGEISTVLLTQIHSYDAARIADTRPIGRISGQDLARIRERIKYLVG